MHRGVEARDEVIQLCVLVSELLDVACETLLYDLPTNVIIHGLDPAGALFIAYGVKGGGCIARVLDWHLDGVCRWIVIRGKCRDQEVEEVAL